MCGQDSATNCGKPDLAIQAVSTGKASKAGDRKFERNEATVGWEQVQHFQSKHAAGIYWLALVVGVGFRSWNAWEFGSGRHGVGKGEWFVYGRFGFDFGLV